jgi:hypothetical protein
MEEGGGRAAIRPIFAAICCMSSSSLSTFCNDVSIWESRENMEFVMELRELELPTEAFGDPLG